MTRFSTWGRNGAVTVLCASMVVGGWPASNSWSQPVGLPNIGSSEAAELSPQIEAELGAAIMAQGRRDPTFIDDTEISQYLTEMGRKLAEFAPGGSPQVQLFAVRDPEINAFALPGGFISINSGLVVSSRSESELAGVVAHEIGHVSQRHVARGMTQQKQSGVLMAASMAAALLAALAGGGANLGMGVAAFGQAAAHPGSCNTLAPEAREERRRRQVVALLLPEALARLGEALPLQLEQGDQTTGDLGGRESQGGEDGQRGDLRERQAPGRQGAGRETERLQAAGQERRQGAAPGAARRRRCGGGLRRHVPRRGASGSGAGCAASGLVCRRRSRR